MLSNTKYVIGILIILELISPFVIKDTFWRTIYRKYLCISNTISSIYFYDNKSNILAMYSINKAYLLTAMNWVQLPINYFWEFITYSNVSRWSWVISTTILRILGGVVYYCLFIKG